jgi:hypothetical protein
MEALQVREELEANRGDRHDAAIESSMPSPTGPASVSASVSSVIAFTPLISVNCVAVSASGDVGGAR